MIDQEEIIYCFIVRQLNTNTETFFYVHIKRHCNIMYNTNMYNA